LSAQKITMPAPVAALAVSPDGRLLAVALGANGKGGVHLLERSADGFKEKWQRWPDARSWGVAFSPTEPWLAVTNEVVPVTWDGPNREPTKLPYSAWVVEVWDLVAQKLINFPEARTIGGRIRALAFSPLGHHLAAGIQFWGKSEARMARVWDTGGQRAFRDFRINRTGFDKERIGGVRSITYSAEGRWLAAADDGDGRTGARCVVWEAHSGEQRWVGGSVAAASAAFAGAAPVFAATEPGAVRCYSVPKFERFGAELPVEKDPDTIALSPDGQLVALKLNGRITLHDTKTGTERQTYPAPGNAWALAFSPDGKNLISGHTDGTVNVWVVPEPS
jgi:WD40 repeat protein